MCFTAWEECGRSAGTLRACGLRVRTAISRVDLAVGAEEGRLSSFELRGRGGGAGVVIPTAPAGQVLFQEGGDGVLSSSV